MNKLESTSVPSLNQISPVVLEKKILKFLQSISLFCYYLPLEKGVNFQLSKLESLSSKDALYEVWLN